MSAVSHVGCPSCGAPIGVSDIDRIFRCAHCDGKLLVTGHDIVSEYWAAPKVDRTAARRAVQRALMSPRLPKGLLRRSRLDAARLYFVPFNEIFARRVGKLLMQKQGRTPSGSKKPSVADTRVVITDIERLAPAVHLEDWGLEQAAIKLSATEQKIEFEPVTRETVASMGSICHPAVLPSQVLEQLTHGADTTAMTADFQYLEQRYRRIFYPVWRIRYTHDKRSFWVSVDGVTGTIMTLRAPESDRARLKWLLGTAMVTAFVLGKSVGAIYSTMKELGAGAVISFVAHPLSLFVVASVLCFLVLLLNTGWEQFRYSGELVFKGDTVDVIKLNKPPGETRIARLVMKLMDHLGERLTPKAPPM